MMRRRGSLIFPMEHSVINTNVVQSIVISTLVQFRIRHFSALHAPTTASFQLQPLSDAALFRTEHPSL